MRAGLLFFRRYPRASLVTVLAFLFSGIAEGIGLLSFLPLLYLSVGSGVGGGDMQGTLFNDVEIMGWMTETLGPNLRIEYIIPAIFAVLSLKNYLILLANRQIGVTMANISFDFRVNVLRSIYRSRWEYFIGQPAGHFSGRLTNEVKRAANTYMNSAVLVSYIVQSLTYLFLAALVSPTLTLLGIPIVALAFTLSRGFISASGQFGLVKTNYVKKIAKRAVESVSGLKAIKAMGRENLLENTFFREIDRLRESQVGLVNATEKLKILQNQIVLFFMLLGLLASFYTSVVAPVEVLLLAAVLMRFFSQATKVSSQIQSLAASESAYYSLQEFLDDARHNSETLQKGTRATLKQSVRLNQVSFAYADKDVLSNLDLEFRANEITSIVGPSGAGKTTLLDLLTGLLQPTHGSVEIDGKNLKNLDTRAWREQIGYVPQEPFLLNDTIYNNVTLGDDGISRQDVIEALEAANAWQFIQALEDTLEFNVGERGGRLSGGQRQRVMIARALVRRPSLLIFDEATSSLDDESEREICKTILDLRQTHTIICASHRPMLVEASDQVIRLNKISPHVDEEMETASNGN